MKQFLRLGLTFVFSGVVASNIATDSLLGIGNRCISKVNVGVLNTKYKFDIEKNVRLKYNNSI